MTEKDFDTLTKLWDELEQQCTRVANAYKTIYDVTLNPRMKECYYANQPTGFDYGGVTCISVPSWANDYETYHNTIPKELICMTDEELNEWVGSVIKKCQKEIDAEREMKEKQQREEKEKLYASLKKELGYV